MFKKAVIACIIVALCLPVAIQSKAIEITASDEVLLDDLSRRCFEYFWNEANPENGLIPDRYSNSAMSSIAAVGFGLAAICIGVERGWVSRDEAYDRVLTTLKTFRDNVEGASGFYYHFVRMKSGKRIPSEVSSIDTALFIAGALTCAQYFKGTDVEKLANLLYERVEWDWMLDEATQTLRMAWKKNIGFEEAKWNTFNESMVLYLLAIGSPTHPIPAETWHKIRRDIRAYGNWKFFSSWPGSLFIHQYSHAFINFKDKNDEYFDYWVNSFNATMANRQFCIDNKDKYPGYGYDVWGISASDGPDGYSGYGIEMGYNDGTIAPYAACGSLPFVPEVSMRAVNTMKQKYGDKIWGKYGFTSAFNVGKDWYSEDYVGIDLGITLLMIENYRTGFMWKYFMKNKPIIRAMKEVGFEEGTMVKPKGAEGGEARVETKGEEVIAIKTTAAITIDADLTEWANAQQYMLLPQEEFTDYGKFNNVDDMAPTFMCMWDDEYLYFAAEVIDNEIVCPFGNPDIYKNDCIEIFLDPQFDMMIWGDPKDAQIGITPDSPSGKPLAYAWFQNIDFTDNENFKFAVKKGSDLLQGKSGYLVEAAIKWSFLNIKPKINYELGMSPSFHDADYDGTNNSKLTWSYRDPGIKLGKMTLAGTDLSDK